MISISLDVPNFIYVLLLIISHPLPNSFDYYSDLNSFFISVLRSVFVEKFEESSRSKGTLLLGSRTR